MGAAGLIESFGELPAGIDAELVRADELALLERDADGYLTTAELERRAGFRSDRRRRTFTLGRVAARSLLSRRLGRSPSQIELVVAADGAVDVGGCGLHLSISHTDEAALAVVSETPVGVDIEPLRQRVDDLFAYVLHPDEYPTLHDADDPNSVALRAWVVKESVLKGMRLGLRHSPKDIRLTFESSGSGRARLSDGVEWRFRQVERDGLVAALAYGRVDPG